MKKNNNYKHYVRGKIKDSRKDDFESHINTLISCMNSARQQQREEAAKGEKNKKCVLTTCN